MKSINPFSSELIRVYKEFSPAETAAVLDSVCSAQKDWSHCSPAVRANNLQSLGGILFRRERDLALLMAGEMGKPVSQGIAELRKCGSCCDYYAQHAENLLSPEIVKTEAHRSFIYFRPLGVVLAIMPWNFPFWQVFRCAIPSLMAGNGVVLKHASNVSGCALALEKLFRESGFPENIFRTVLLPSSRVGELLQHSAIRAVSVTGSTHAGKEIAAAAGKLLKKTVLELGGSDPYLVLEDADLKDAAETCAASRMINAGQSCISAKRFIVVEPVYAEFEELFTGIMQKQRYGDPQQEGNHFGPLARADLRDSLHQQVQRSVDQGARLLLGGKIPSGPGAFYPATVLTRVTPTMTAATEELFGPVAALICARDEKDAVQIANGTSFGLGAAVFTRDLERGERIAREEIEAGCCFVNDYVRSDPRLPFGGVRESGYGRELSSFGLREFTNIKTVQVR